MLGGALAMSFLAGFPAVTLMVYATTAAAGWSAVQLVPSVETARQSAASNRWAFNEPGGLPALALLSAIWPNAWHVFTPSDPAVFHETANFTFLYLYSGQLAVWLALAALLLRKSPGRLYLGIAALCALILFGGRLPGYLAIFHLLPKVVQSSAYTEFALAGFSLAIAVTAALSLQQLTGRTRAGRRPLHWPPGSNCCWWLPTAP